MNLALRCVERLTRERDRPTLKMALAEALRSLLGVNNVIVFNLLNTSGETLVWPDAQVDDHGSQLTDDGMSLPSDMVSIERFPLLAACQQHGGHQQNGEHAVLPLCRSNGTVFGFVALSGKRLETAEFEVADQLLAIYTNMLALLDYSEIDTLTGLLNRKTFDHYLMRILYNPNGGDDDRVEALRLPKRRSLHPQPLDHWLGVLDVDHFKRVNDSFGHMIGDEMLLLIATLMKGAFRAHDKLFRFGGEEFVMLLKPTEEANAHAAFERLREKVEAFTFPQAGRITVSIGYVRIRADEQPSVILERADAALYWAKEQGRNRIANYESLVAAGLLAAREKISRMEFF